MPNRRWQDKGLPGRDTAISKLRRRGVPHMKDDGLRSPSEHSSENSVGNGFEVGTYSNVVLNRPDTLVGCQIALGNVSDHKSCSGSIIDYDVAHTRVRRNS
jgi:hypothetical protein